MRVTIRLFARLRDIAGATELARDLPTGATIVCTFGLVLIVMACLRPLLVRARA